MHNPTRSVHIPVLKHSQLVTLILGPSEQPIRPSVHPSGPAGDGEGGDGEGEGGGGDGGGGDGGEDKDPPLLEAEDDAAAEEEPPPLDEDAAAADEEAEEPPFVADAAEDEDEDDSCKARCALSTVDTATRSSVRACTCMKCERPLRRRRSQFLRRHRGFNLTADGGIV